MIESVDTWLQQLADRLEQGSIEYGNQSMTRPVSSLVDEIRQELLDEVGWTYILWAAASRKCGGARPESEFRDQFLFNLRHRLARNDRSRAEQAPGLSLQACIIDLEILAMDMFLHAQQIEMRLHPLARAIEVAQVMDPYRGRRGSGRNPRSND